MKDEWYFLDSNNEKHGPFSYEELSNKIDSNELPDDILISSTEDENWVPANQVLYSDSVQAEDSDATYNITTESDMRYEKVGGWLLFFCLSLVIFTPLIGVFSLITSVDQLQSSFLPDNFMSYFTIITIIEFALIGFGMYIGIKLWQIAPYAVQNAKKYLVIVLVVQIIQIFIPYLFDFNSSIRDALLEESLKYVARTVIAVAIWLAYLRKSKRVKATYCIYE